MGTKQTKIEGNYLPDTPVAASASQRPAAAKALEAEDSLDAQDPRSPNGQRTPITSFTASIPQNTEPSCNAAQTSANFQPGVMRKGFFRGLIYNLSDPRSPTIHVNRSPLILEEAHNRTLDLNDTFADLFIESRTSHNRLVDDMQMAITTPNTDVKTIFPSVVESNCAQPQQTKDFISEANETPITYSEEETILCPMVLNETPVLLQQQLDPRSPTVGVERTPITFKDDDDESNEDMLLENILATHSLNLSGISSNALFNVLGSTGHMSSLKNSPISELRGDLLAKKPANKHLDCVREGRKLLSRKTICRQPRQHVYEDTENKSPPLYTTTVNVAPKTKVCDTENGCVKRTPLSCMKNRSHLRSRSVETPTKSLKTRLPLTCFDDILNPVQSPKVANSCIVQNSDGSLEI